MKIWQINKQQMKIWHKKSGQKKPLYINILKKLFVVFDF